MRSDEIIDRLMERRAERGLSLRALAEIVGYDFNTLSGWETRYRQPKLHSVVDWCDALDLEIRIENRG